MIFGLARIIMRQQHISNAGYQLTNCRLTHVLCIIDT